jgi:hypothetical protein
VTTPLEKAAEFRVKTNPDYDHDAVEFDHDNTDQNEFRFWNPVSAVNDLIKLANGALELAAAMSEAVQARAAAKLAKAQAEADLAAFEHRLIAADELTPTEAKSNKTIEAALALRAQNGGAATQLVYRTLKDAVTKEQEVIDRMTARADALDMWFKANERASNNLTNALSFYKDERKRAYKY